MEPNQVQNAVYPKTTAKDFFLHLGTMVALYSFVISLVNLLFTVINKAYPQTTGYYGYGTYSISMPVSVLIIMFPIFILLMWLLERGYKTEPEKRHIGIKRWLTYITLFISGLITAGDLITIVYYFIDGREMTISFVLKFLTVFAVSLSVFMYYITDIRGKLTSVSRKVWTIVSLIVILGVIIVGFSVLGSPRNQQLIKYDQRRVSDLQSIKYQVEDYYQTKGSLPDKMSDLNTTGYYMNNRVDPKTNVSYEYNLIGQSAKAYSLCANFDTDSTQQTDGTDYYSYNTSNNWSHPKGHYCFPLSISVPQYKTLPPTTTQY